MEGSLEVQEMAAVEAAPSVNCPVVAFLVAFLVAFRLNDDASLLKDGLPVAEAVDDKTFSQKWW